MGKGLSWRRSEQRIKEDTEEAKRYHDLVKSDFGVVVVAVQTLSWGRLFVTQWTVAFQAPPSVGFPRLKY